MSIVGVGAQRGRKEECRVAVEGGGSDGALLDDTDDLDEDDSG